MIRVLEDDSCLCRKDVKVCTEEGVQALRCGARGTGTKEQDGLQQLEESGEAKQDDLPTVPGFVYAPVSVSAPHRALECCTNSYEEQIA